VRIRTLSDSGVGYVLLSIPLRPDPRVAQLTNAERHVLRALVTGAPNELVAAVRRTSIRTVTNQVHQVFAKTGMHSRAEAAQAFADAIIDVREDARP
jgi:DNA-binding NarL/FixJ family response regulator